MNGNNSIRKDSLGMFISKKREEFGYTQSELGEKLNISSDIISSWESGETQPDAQMIRLLASVFEITCDELLNYDKEKEKDARNSVSPNLKSIIRLKTYQTVTFLLIGLIIILGFFIIGILEKNRTGFNVFDTKIINGVAYEKCDGGWEVVGISRDFRDGTAILEDTIKGGKVIKIKRNAFSNTFNLRSIVLSKNIIAIESQAFMLSSIETIVLNDGIQRIDKHAFYKSSISSIYFPDSLQTIGVSAFEDCTRLVEVTGGNGLYLIEKHAFLNCARLKDVSITGNVIVETGAFENTANLITVKLTNVRAMYTNSFVKSGVVNVYFPEDGNKKIGKYVFYECYALQSVYLGETRYGPEVLFGE